MPEHRNYPNTDPGDDQPPSNLPAWLLEQVPGIEAAADDPDISFVLGNLQTAFGRLNTLGPTMPATTRDAMEVVADEASNRLLHVLREKGLYDGSFPDDPLQDDADRHRPELGFEP